MTDREDLYQQAHKEFFVGGHATNMSAIRAVVDLVLDADRQPWEVLREADKLIRGHWNFDGIDSTRLLALAKDLEAEHQEKAEREAAREKLIEQAARLTVKGVGKRWESITESGRRDAREVAVVLVDAGWRPAPTTDGGAK